MGIYSNIVGEISLGELTRAQTAYSTLGEDLRAILSKKAADATSKQTLVDARIGQGAFRSAVLQLWDHRCSVTGSTTMDVIRASHIKPWRDSTDEERLDPMNGLALVASLDALFDAGLISFEDSGRMLVASELPQREREILGVVGRSLAKKPSTETAAYLQHHRDRVFRK
jgi:predicted restriction endonuclease